MKKFVAVVDRNYETAFMINAVGHLALGMGNKISNEDGRYSSFHDINNKNVSYLTDFPLIILGGKSSNKLKSVHENAIAENIIHNVYYDVMFDGSVEEQLSKISSEEYLNQKYVAIMLFGDSDALNKITKRISLLS